MQFQTTYSLKINQERRSPFKFTLLFAISCILTFSSCEDSFDPLEENNKYHFSIYGTLDAAVDTQWVRIGVPRGNMNETPDPDGVTVTLKDVETGQSMVMQDSLFTSRDLLNYWTTMPLENEHTYQIQAERTDGKSSQVSVTIPAKLSTPLVTWQDGYPTGYNIYIDDSVHLADIQTKWYVLLHPQTERLKQTYTFTYRNTVYHTATYGGAHVAFANTTEERRHITQSNSNADFVVLHRQFFVAAGGPEWDENISSIDDLEYFLDGTASNVENGLGYVVGIDSKWVPYKGCELPGGSNVTPCEPEKPFW